jgi:hypothetical protein
LKVVSSNQTGSQQSSQQSSQQRENQNSGISLDLTTPAAGILYGEDKKVVLTFQFKIIT